MGKRGRNAERVESSSAVGSGSAFVGLVIANTTVFVSSYCIMVIELVAGRLIAQYLGSSLYTWTSIIGVVLAGIAFGNYVGGRLADRFAPDRPSAKRVLAILFLIAGAASAGLSWYNNMAGELGILWTLESWPLRVALHIALVFFTPCMILGMISPVVAKMALDLGRETGRTIGSVYAWGVVGSIVGTFVTGYYYVAVFSTTTIVLGVAFVLLAVAVLYGASSLRKA